jgi:LPXTG-site transpeptidase (sortase) family protein
MISKVIAAMSSNSETLDISGLRHAPEIPLAEVAEARNPEAAAYARARIDALAKHNPLLDPQELVAVPTTQLVTDRHVLASQAETAPAVRRRMVPSVVRPLLTAVGIFALMLLLFKLPVIISQVQYSLHKPVVSAAPVVNTTVPAENSITIPKINVHAPVIYEPSVAEANVQKALESGVDHYGNTPAPGEKGNAVIFGHSSNDWWEPGNYKFVFVLLDKLVVGDQFSVDYNSKRYTYEVTGSKVVPPTDLSVLAPTAEPTLTLITCSPPGTSINRLIVTAKQVDPNPNGAVAAATPASQSQSNLPGAAPGLFDQIGQAVQGIIHGISSLFGADGGSPTSSPSPQPGTASSLPAAK